MGVGVHPTWHSGVISGGGFITLSITSSVDVGGGWLVSWPAAHPGGLPWHKLLGGPGMHLRPALPSREVWFTVPPPRELGLPPDPPPYPLSLHLQPGAVQLNKHGGCGLLQKGPGAGS